MGIAAMTIETRPKAERFAEVALEHMDLLYKSALYMSKNESDAQDLVQDTYLKAYRFFDTFKEGTNCRAWLLKILQNTFINVVNHKKTQPETVELLEMDGNEAELSPGTHPEDLIFWNLLDDDVTAAVDGLLEKYRTAVVLADVKGLSYKEIADVMDCPIGTVMSRLHRGRSLLKRRLRNYAVQHGYIGNGN